ncbi:hypothetical protein ACFE04_025181 [Oxalis oulophora]
MASLSKSLLASTSSPLVVNNNNNNNNNKNGCRSLSLYTHYHSTTTTTMNTSFISPVNLKLINNNKRRNQHQICKMAEYKFPDPIPQFADEETDKFRANLVKKLSKKDVCGDSVDQVVNICTEIFSTFMHTEYGGPGTLLVMPFIDMADTINERDLPGGPQAARFAVKWAQDHVDKDWKEWTGTN